jgi:telomerase reverse transcriptase
VAASLTLPLAKRPGATLAQKLCAYLRPKIHPLLLDPVINSPTTVRLNVYQAFLLAAMKFHCHTVAMPAPPGAATLMAAIEVGITFMTSLVRPRRVAPGQPLRGAAAVACAPRLSGAHVRCLGLRAFRTVLGRKQARYRDLLAALDAALAAPSCARCAKHLAAAIDPGRSSDFAAIIY